MKTPRADRGVFLFQNLLNSVGEYKAAVSLTPDFATRFVSALFPGGGGGATAYALEWTL